MAHRAGIAAVLILAVAPVKALHRTDGLALAHLVDRVVFRLLRRLADDPAPIHKTFPTAFALQAHGDELGQAFGGFGFWIIDHERPHLLDRFANAVVIIDIADEFEVDVEQFLRSGGQRDALLDLLLRMHHV